MQSKSQAARFGGCLVLMVAAAEVIIMSSPFAALFYSSFGFQGFQGFLSQHASTAWLTSFFLNSSAMTTSKVLEWHRELGSLLISIGLWGFLISAAQVYGNKLLKRGVAKSGLYKVSRHPQYLCLAIAGWGMVAVWPRILFLGMWVTMLFLYAGLARFEEQRMAERFGDDYLDFRASRAYFLPGSPVRRLFEASFGRIRPVALGWISAYLLCLTLAFGLALPLRQYTINHLSLLELPEDNVLAISVWPTDEQTMTSTLRAVIDRPNTGIPFGGEEPLFVTLMPTDYRQKASYYLLNPSQASFARLDGLTWKNLGRLVRAFLVPTRGYAWGSWPLMGHPPTDGDKVHFVVAKADKAYLDSVLPLEDVLDLGVRWRPLAVTNVIQGTRTVGPIRRTMPQNVWGPDVVMPMF